MEDAAKLRVIKRYNSLNTKLENTRKEIMEKNTQTAGKIKTRI